MAFGRGKKAAKNGEAADVDGGERPAKSGRSRRTGADDRELGGAAGSYHYCRKLFHPGQGMRLEVHDLRAGC